MNHKPAIRGTDLGIWRRIQLIPFEQSLTSDPEDARINNWRANSTLNCLGF